MARSFQDKNFMQWEAFASTGKQGFSNDPHIVFQCVTKPSERPRWTQVSGDQDDAQAMLMNADDQSVLGLFEASVELP